MAVLPEALSARSACAAPHWARMLHTQPQTRLPRRVFTAPSPSIRVCVYGVHGATRCCLGRSVSARDRSSTSRTHRRQMMELRIYL